MVAKEGLEMNRRSARDRFQELWRGIKRFLKRDPETPEDPYAFVGAPKRPRPPYRRAAAAEPLD
jgi:hypothetical protein